MADETSEAGGVDEWGPVCRGFRVSLPAGERGCVEEIRCGDGAVELIVATGFVRRLLAIPAHEIEAILPAARRILVRGSHPGLVRGDAAGKLEAVGGIVRMPVRHSSRIGTPPKQAA